MVKPISHSFLFAFFLGLSVSQATRSIQPGEPQFLKDFKIELEQYIYFLGVEPDQTAASESARTCSYTVRIKTSCSSPAYARDQVSLDFGDSHGNEVYAPRLDDPSSGTFERCSTDTFQIRGPCTYQVCYLYLMRVGYEYGGWIPESVKVYSPDGSAYTFNYNTQLPSGVWSGFNHCNAMSKPNFVAAAI